MDLLLLPTTHVSGLGTLVLIVKCQSMLLCVTEEKKRTYIDITPELNLVRERTLLSLLNGGINLLLGSLINRLQASLVSRSPFENVLFQAGNGVLGRSHLLNFFSSSVSRTGVGHGVATVSVSDKLDEEGTLAGSGPFLGPFSGFSDGEDVHTVNLVPWLAFHFPEEGGVDLTYLETGDLVTTGKELSVHRRSLGRSTHTVLVVLTDKDAGEVPELGHVESLKDLALVGGTVTVEGKSSGLFLVVLLGKGDTGADGNLFKGIFS